jgi:glycine C-acetyltransferase
MLRRSVSSATHRAFSSAARNPLVDRLRDELAAIDAAGTYKRERVIASPQGAEIRVNDQRVLNFCANNYLGLSNHPAVVEAAKSALDSHGFGLSSVRFICGTQDIHKRLEQVISDFHGTEDTILYPSCFDANAGIFEATLNHEDAIITDELNHASIIDGVRLSKAERHRFKHMDLGDLEAKLQQTQHCRTRMIVTDGVFSMDGDVAPLKEICDLADAYNAQVFIDECHATGFFGATGRGSDQYCGVQGRVDIINSTLGKALGGGTGGYTTGRQEVIDVLRQRSRPYLFSNSLSPPVVGASLKVFEMLTASSDFVDTIRANTHRFRDRMTAAGFTLKGAYDHPIAPVMIGDARLAAQLADDMLNEGIYVIGFSYPVRATERPQCWNLDTDPLECLLIRWCPRARRGSACSCRRRTRLRTSTRPSTRSSSARRRVA